MIRTSNGDPVFESPSPMALRSGRRIYGVRGRPEIVRPQGRVRLRRLLVGLFIAVPVLLTLDTFVRAPSIAKLRKINPAKTHWMQVRQAQTEQKGKKWRMTQEWVPLSQISKSARRAVLAAEDAAFYDHGGFDPHEIVEAIKKDWRRKKWSSGASTISQQVAKNLWLSPRKSLWRKAEEAVLTVRLESALDKNRILEIYLNTAEWGPGLFGIEAAANRYLGKSSSELGAEDGALLAAMLPNPYRLSPERNMRAVEKRQSIILRRMRRMGWWQPPPAVVEPPVSTVDAEEEVEEIPEAEEPTNGDAQPVGGQERVDDAVPPPQTDHSENPENSISLDQPEQGS